MLPRCVESEWSNPRIIIGERQTQLYDLDRAMAFLEGKSLEQVDTVCEAFNRLGNRLGNRALGHQFKSTYFEGRGYKKGTLHLYFKDEFLWERFNIEAAKGKNWLPDDYKAREKAERAAAKAQAQDQGQKKKQRAADASPLLALIA